MTGEVKVIKIADIAGSSCISSDDGDKVYPVIHDALKNGYKVQLSFEGIEDMISAFLNSAVGRLYNGDFSEELLRTSLYPINASEEDLVLLKRVVDRAKEFFRDPEKFNKAVSETLGSEDE